MSEILQSLVFSIAFLAVAFAFAFALSINFNSWFKW
jgi:hypothetical protein